MSRTLPILASLLVLAGCTNDPEVGNRFRAERALWNVNQVVQRYSVRPALVSDADWSAVAARYEEIADTFQAGHDTPAGRDVRLVEARALISAGQIYGALGDTARMDANYARVEAEYGGLGAISAEAALARGRLAEQRGDIEVALAGYRLVLSEVDPRVTGAGVARTVLELPLRISRIEARSVVDPTPEKLAPLYKDARLYYAHWADAGTDPTTRIEARAYLGEVAADLRDWTTAATELRRTEREVLAVTPNPKDPGVVRLSLARAMLRGGAPADTTINTLKSVADDYPSSPASAEALFALAEIAAQQDRTDEALAHLKRVRESKQATEAVAARSLLFEGQVLAHAGRWTEAQDVFRSIPVEHPISEAALVAPLEIYRHYVDNQDEAAAQASLERAERGYRDFLERYPAAGLSLMAREKLARTLTIQKRSTEAIEEYLRLSDLQRGSNTGARYLVTAANIAYQDLSDTLRAAELLERTADQYAGTGVGTWAAEQAGQLRNRMVVP